MTTILNNELPRRISRKEVLTMASKRISCEVSDVLLDAVKTCISCRYWSKHKLEHCDLYNARPPAAIIAFGCDSFKDIEEECPF